MRNSTDTYVTVHVRLDRNYARAMDSIGEKLGTPNCADVFEAGVICLAEKMGIDNLPSRLPIPARHCLEKYLKVN